MDLDSLRRAARQCFNETTAANRTTDIAPAASLSADVHALNLASLTKRLAIPSLDDDMFQIFEKLVVLDKYLSTSSNLSSDVSVRHAVVPLREWVANVMLPSRAFAEKPPYSLDETPQLTPDDVAQGHAIAVAALMVLSHLRKVALLTPEKPDVAVLTSLAAFSDEHDTWNDPRAQEQACLLLEDYLASDHLSTLLTSILETRVRPCFDKSKNPAITQQGRKAIVPIPSNAALHSNLDTASKSWKYSDSYTITVFQWVLCHLTESSLHANWPLIIPPLLALIDDTSVKYKVKGCSSLVKLLRICPSFLLERTGLGEVFEDAMMPCLLALPSLAEETESLEMLNAAYPALITLALARFPDESEHPARIKALDRVMRQGVLKGHAHAGEHVKISEMLVRQIGNLVNEMGIEFVKYLKDVLPLLSQILASPFGTAYPPLLHASINAVRAIIVNNHARVLYHRGEILRGLTVCWCRIMEHQQHQQSKDFALIQQSILETVRLLKNVLKRDVDVAEEYQTLVDSDPRLWDLLVADGRTQRGFDRSIPCVK